MTIEQSHGKARPTLPRASDLRPAEPDTKPIDARGAHGHFAAGNRTGLGARFVATIKKALGPKIAGTPEGKVIVRDAKRVFGHTLRSMASDAPPVRALVAMYARHYALNAYFTAKAEEAGLTTPQGLKLLEVADRQSQRAERVLVTAQDLARIHAEQEERTRGPVDPLAAYVRPRPKEGATDGNR